MPQPSQPLQTMDFAGLAIDFDDRVLRPRHWTEMQSRWAAELLADAPPGPFLELCCGAGHIGLLTAALSGRSMVAVDLNPAACDLTARNARTAGLGDRVEVRQGRLEEILLPEERYAVVVADPPWVTRAGVGRFPEDPLLAIDGGDDGLDVARAILAASAPVLTTYGSLLVQLGDEDQADRLVAEAESTGWRRGAVRTGERGVVLRLVSAAG